MKIRMLKVVSRAALLAALVPAAACEDGTGSEGAPSTFEVQAYVELDGTAGMTAGDQPVSAVVTVASNSDDLVLVDSTGADGRVFFDDIPAGAYTVTHAPSSPEGLDLIGSPSQTVVAPFAGDSVVTRFVYALAAGTLTGVTFRDINGSTFYEAGEDSVYRDVDLLLFAGADTLGTPVATTATDDDGVYDFGAQAPGEYTLLVREPALATVLGANPRAITIAPGDTTFHAIELVGDPTGPVITIAQARATAVDDTVKVRGVVTAGQGTYRTDSFYLQDSTSGIFVFGVDSALGLAVGDSVQVIGERWEFREEAFLVARAIAPLGDGAVPAPVTITASDLNAGLFQGELATLSANVDSITAGDGGYEVWVHDGTADALVFVDNDTGIPQSEFTLNTIQSFTGVLGTFDADDDGVIEHGDYQLKPRSATDVN